MIAHLYWQQDMWRLWEMIMTLHFNPGCRRTRQCLKPVSPQGAAGAAGRLSAHNYWLTEGRCRKDRSGSDRCRSVTGMSGFLKSWHIQRKYQRLEVVAPRVHHHERSRSTRSASVSTPYQSFLLVCNHRVYFEKPRWSFLSPHTSQQLELEVTVSCIN